MFLLIFWIWKHKMFFLIPSLPFSLDTARRRKIDFFSFLPFSLSFSFSRLASFFRLISPCEWKIIFSSNSKKLIEIELFHFIVQIISNWFYDYECINYVPVFVFVGQIGAIIFLLFKRGGERLKEKKEKTSKERGRKFMNIWLNIKMENGELNGNKLRLLGWKIKEILIMIKSYYYQNNFEFFITLNCNSPDSLLTSRNEVIKG